ncbi:MAG: DALR anticodon-binding domain-containing protein, partial [Polyangiales bacterium]
PDGPFDPARLEPGAERDLADAYTRLKPTFDAAVQARRYREALQTLAEQLQGPIHQFFVDVFVMVEDEALRANRLRLLAAIAALTRPIGALHTLAPKHSPQFTVEGEYAHPVDVG